MSQADELLDVLAEQAESRLADPSSEPHIAINADRSVTVPDALKTIAVQHDHNIETVTFDCPAYWDGHDLSEMQIYVNYMRPDGVTGRCPVTNIRPDETDETIFHFDWTISKSVTAVKGQLKFLVCGILVDFNEYEKTHWNSRINEDLYIAEGLECETIESNIYPDVITAMFARITALEENQGTGGGSAVVKKQVTLLGSAWLGEADHYTQVVEINGVTPTSKVDLQPNEEQHEIFADKKLLFFAVNDGGVVTVHLIGQKPENDYTIQCTLTEVTV